MYRGKMFPLGLFCHSVRFSRPRECNHNLDLKEESVKQNTYCDNKTGLTIKITHFPFQ